MKGVQLYNQLQKMNLVVSYEDEKANTTDLYVLDELHAVFTPHIDDVISHPVDYSTEKTTSLTSSTDWQMKANCPMRPRNT